MITSETNLPYSSLEPSKYNSCPYSYFYLDYHNN